MPAPLRGKYRAFSPQHILAARGGAGSSAGGGAGSIGSSSAGEQPTAGLAHLSSLRAAGLTHIHLLPSYDYGSVPEREEEQLRVEVSSCFSHTHVFAPTPRG